MAVISAFGVTQHSQIFSLFFRNRNRIQMHCALSVTQFPGSAQLTPWLLYFTLIKRKDLKCYLLFKYQFIK